MSFPAFGLRGALARWRRVWGRGQLPVVETPPVVVRRGETQQLPWMRLTLRLEGRHLGPTVRLLAAAAAQVCASHRGTVGSITVVPGEEPVLVALAPLRDLVAQRLQGALLAGESHRAPHVLLLLRPGVFLAQAVDPFAPWAGTLDTLAGVVGAGLATLAGRFTIEVRRRWITLEAELIAVDRHTLRVAWSSAWRAARLSRG